MIDYSLLARAIEYYKSKNFQYIEVPWIVSENTNSITRPKAISPHSISGINFDLEAPCLVASAEQSFLQLVKARKLKGKYQAITPCFRNEPVYDETHLPWFMKCELFDNDFDDEYDSLKFMMISTNEFLHNSGIDTEIIHTGEGFDIIDSKTGIELGSYGIREHPSVGKWVYGTGCAEPRTSYCIRKANEKRN